MSLEPQEYQEYYIVDCIDYGLVKYYTVYSIVCISLYGLCIVWKKEIQVVPSTVDS